jgi:hypothetical protein
MNLETESSRKYDAINRILATDEELIPSSGFLAAVMERVREEAAAPPPIPFPWKRAVPGILLLAGVLGWAAIEFVQCALAAARELPMTQPHLPTTIGPALAPAGCIAFALVVSLLCWLFSTRLVRRSSLL